MTNTPELIPFAWISVNEATDEDGFYLEDRDEAMVEALVTPGFAEWAKSREGEAKTEPVDNGLSNLVYYDEEAPNSAQN